MAELPVAGSHKTYQETPLCWMISFALINRFEIWRNEEGGIQKLVEHIFFIIFRGES